MGTTAGSLLIILPVLAVVPRGAGPADPFTDFGSLYYVAIGLDVLNTVVVLYFLWKIWFREKTRS